MHYRVIVVGAGPAGISTALHLHRNGVQCCLIDKATFPRFKLCGGLITEKTADLLKSYGIDDFDTVVKEKTNKVNILNNKQNVVSITTEKYFNLVDRMEFDNWLLNKYIICGGEAILGERVIEIDLDDKIVKTEKDNYSYDYVVGADGAKGVSSKLVERHPISYAFGMETEVSTSDEGDKDVSIDLDVAIAKDGYGWRFPKGKKTLYGYAFSYSKNIDYNSFTKSYLPGGTKAKGAFLPYGGNLKTVVNEKGLLLVGDAAGFVDAVTGEGTYYAIKSGELAAEALVHDNPVEAYRESSKYIVDEVNKSWRLISLFYKFRKLVLKIAPSHGEFIAFVCDYQVSTQACDFNPIKMLRYHKRLSKK